MRLKIKRSFDPIEPTPQQIFNSSLQGWEYVGDNLFIRGDNEIGYFTKHGFVKE